MMSGRQIYLPVKKRRFTVQNLPFIELILQPWEKHPRQLVTWWDMLDFSAWNFFWCGLRLQRIEMDCYMGSMVVPGDTPIFAVPKPLDDDAREKAVESLERIEPEFSRIGLRITAATVRELIEDLKKPDGATTPTRQNFQWLIQQINVIQGLSKKEIEGKAFFYVPAERITFFPKMKNPHIFGNAVNVAFPNAAQDVCEAGVCLALDRGTGCVFHLMRILEIGLTALGAKFGVSLAHANWAPAIEQIESKIRDMHKDSVWKALPDCKEQQEFYAQAASHFGILKDAWRNYTMHVRGFYTEEQAERIFENVKAFMQKLAERLSDDDEW
jgi:hypothetical protein